VLRHAPLSITIERINGAWGIRVRQGYHWERFAGGLDRSQAEQIAYSALRVAAHGARPRVGIFG
jgi:hypothetical protein